MKAILTQTIGPHHRAGDVVKSSNTKIKRLVDKGVATTDHSVIGMFGSVITWVVASFIMLVATMAIFPDSKLVFGVIGGSSLSSLWIWTLIIFPFLAIIVALTQFYNAKNPYIAYFLATSISLFGGILIMIGHENATSRYQDKRMSGLASLLLIPLGVVTFIIMSTQLFNFGEAGEPTFVGTKEFVTWTIYVVLVMIGVSIAIFFDSDFLHRRRRFIEFLQRKNTAIEYKDKALKALKVFKQTHNQESFNERMVDIFEHTMEQDMKDVLEHGQGHKFDK